RARQIDLERSPDGAERNPGRLRNWRQLSRISLRSIQATGKASLVSSEAANVLDNSGKIHPAVAGLIEGLIDLLRMLTERRRSTRGPGGVLRQRQVLDHQ